MTIGKRQRDIVAILQDCEEDGERWTAGELWNDAGMWSVTSVASDGMRYSRRCQADQPPRLIEQGYVMYKETRPGAGAHGADRVVFVLTRKGELA